LDPSDAILFSYKRDLLLNLNAGYAVGEING